MAHFVNRETELKRVSETVALLHHESLVPTPIYEFHGVGGIGKTTLLEKIKEHCLLRQVPHIWVDANHNYPLFWHTIMKQIQSYSSQLLQHDAQQDIVYQCIYATKSLLTQSPLIILLDSLEAASPEQMRRIETMLRDLIDDNKLLVIVASKKLIDFTDARSISRKLVTIPIHTFSKDDCHNYVDMLITTEPEIRDTIFDWTHGYPLAVNVMIEGIRDEHLDPRTAEGRNRLMTIVHEQVVKRGIFSNLIQPSSTDLELYQTMLSLLSVARCSVVPIMRELIEQFAPQHILPSNMAYMALFKRINQATEVLQWDKTKAGYAVEASIRHIFLTNLQVEQPARYYQIHAFLARLNKRLAEEVSGENSVRFLQEYLYHSASAADQTELPRILADTLEQIVAELQDNFSHFEEEFSLDTELQTALGTHTDTMRSSIYKQLAQQYYTLTKDYSSNESVFYLHQFFSYVIRDPLITNLLPILIEHIQYVIETFPASVGSQLHEKLVHDDTLIAILGNDRNIFSFLLTPEKPPQQPGG